MKKFTILLSLFIVFQSQIIFGADFERVLTLDSSIQTATSVNPDLLNQAQYSEIAQERIREARALYMPSVDLNFNLSSFNNLSPTVISNNATQTLIFLPADQKEIYYNTRISIWQTIYSGGRISATNKLANINLNKAEIESAIIKNRVLYKVKLTFNDCLYYKEQVKYLELLAGKRNEPALKQRIEFARLNYNKKLLELFNAIGLELNTIANISGDFKPIIKSLDLNRCLLLAYQFKPEIRATQYQESIDGLMVSLLSMQKYPIISFSAAQEWRGDERVINDENNWYIAMNINVPLFDGGALFSRIRQGKINVREATLRRTKSEDTIRLEVYKCYLDYSYYRNKALETGLDKKDRWTESDLELIRDLNDSYYNLEYSIGVQLDQY